MKFSLLTVLTIALLSFSSCSKDGDQLTDDVKDQPIETGSDDTKDEKETDYTLQSHDCFELVYPVNFIMPDQSVITLTEPISKEDTPLIDWYKNNPKTDQKPMLEYPIEVIVEGEQLSVDNKDQLETLKAECDEDKGEDKEDEKDGDWEHDDKGKDGHWGDWGYDNDCFSFVYPLTLVFEDGHTVTGDDKAALATAVKDYYTSNPDSKSKFELQYPVNVELADASLVTIADKTEFKDILLDCFQKDFNGHDDKDGDRGPCFEIQYPVSFLMPDNSTISGDNKKDIREDIKTWYENNESDQRPSLVFPINVQLKDESIISINSEEELKALKEDCNSLNDDDNDNNGDNDDKDEDCLSFVYPISYTMPDGSMITGTSAEELRALLTDWYDNNDSDERPQIVFPIEVEFEDRGIITVNNQEELRALRHACNDDHKEYDCPDLRADIGDDCRTDDGERGTVTEDCECA